MNFEIDSIKKNGLDSNLGLVVNAAIANNQCPTSTGYYGPEISVLGLLSTS